MTFGLSTEHRSEHYECGRFDSEHSELDILQEKNAVPLQYGSRLYILHTGLSIRETNTSRVGRDADLSINIRALFKVETDPDIRSTKTIIHVVCYALVKFVWRAVSKKGNSIQHWEHGNAILGPSFWLDMVPSCRACTITAALRSGT